MFTPKKRVPISEIDKKKKETEDILTLISGDNEMRIYSIKVRKNRKDFFEKKKSSNSLSSFYFLQSKSGYLEKY